MLQPSGLAVLNEMGLAEAAIRSGVRIGRIHGEADGRVVLDVRYSALETAPAFAIGIHRAPLFEILHGAVIAAGVRIVTGRAVCPPSAGTFNRLFFENAPDEGPFDVIVDALGTRSPLARSAGQDLAYGALWTNVDLGGARLAPDALSQRYRGASTMAGVLPIGAGPGDTAAQASFFWSLRADRYGEWRSLGLDAWKAEVLELWPETAPLLDRIQSPDALTFARYTHASEAGRS